MLRPGATHTPGEAARHEARAAAEAVWRLGSSGLGPWGAWKLADGRIVRAAEALRGMPEDPFLAPYQRLVAHVAAAGGHSLLATVLAARLVVRQLDAPGRLPQRLQGLLAARRQALAWLAAEARAGSLQECLRAVAGDAGGVLEEVQRLGDLDAVDVRRGDVEAPAWCDGLVVEPKHAPRGAVEGGVLLVGELLMPRRAAPSLRITSTQALAEADEAGEARLRRLREALASVRIVVCRKGGDAVEAVARSDLLIVTDAPEGLIRRAAWATGAVPVPDALHATADDIGWGRASKRRRDWLLSGKGPSGTVEVPGHGPWASVRVEEAETWLRAVAPVSQDLRIVPGGGAWQRGASAALRRAADHAGAAGPGITAAAAALDDVASALVQNAGHDPTRVHAVVDVDDAYACVRPALAGAFDVAMQVLRVDAAYAKRSSRPRDLRGSLAPAGSPKGMPGDLPPLM